MTCSIFEILMKLTLDHFFGIVTNTSWWDTNKISCALHLDAIGKALAYPKSEDGNILVHIFCPYGTLY